MIIVGYSTLFMTKRLVWEFDETESTTIVSIFEMRTYHYLHYLYLVYYPDLCPRPSSGVYRSTGNSLLNPLFKSAMVHCSLIRVVK